MKVWYLGCTSMQESYPYFDICLTCSFRYTEVECCANHLFDDLHPCCSRDKHYQEITKSDIFKL